MEEERLDDLIALLQDKGILSERDIRELDEKSANELAACLGEDDG